MTILWINLAIVFIFSLCARYFSTPVLTIDERVVTVRPHKFFICIALLSLVFVSGLRANIGDTYFYKHAYMMNDMTWSYILSDKDIGFGILQMLLKNYVSEDPQALIFMSSLITNVLIVIVLYNYSRLIELSLYVYITGGLFLVSMNGIRQVLAAAIAFTAIKFLIEGKWLKYALVIIFASFFHQSALILLPIYFLVRLKAWSRATVALILLSVVIVIGYEQFSSLLFAVIEDTQYSHYKTFVEGGANKLRVAVTATPLIAAYIGRKRLREICPYSDYLVNMVILGLVFMVISTQNWIFARFFIYFEFYQLILISWVVKIFHNRDQKLIYFGILVCYFIYYYFESVLSLNIMYRSDYLLW